MACWPPSGFFPLLFAPDHHAAVFLPATRQQHIMAYPRNRRRQLTFQSQVAGAKYVLIWLVVWTPLKNISQLGLLFPIYGKTNPCSSHHQPVIIETETGHVFLRLPQGSRLNRSYTASESRSNLNNSRNRKGPKNNIHIYYHRYTWTYMDISLDIGTYLIYLYTYISNLSLPICRIRKCSHITFTFLSYIYTHQNWYVQSIHIALSCCLHGQMLWLLRVLTLW